MLRALSERGLADWRAATESGLIEHLLGARLLVGTEDADPALVRGALGGSDPAGALRHERIPFISYPYEWPFSMLRRAALLQLDVLLAALDRGITLKDASSYNVQFAGSRPVFIDAGSFEPWTEGEPWAGYRQFCMLFLYPLLLCAHRGVDFHPLLRGSVDGIAPEAADSMLSLRDHLRRGVLTHVHLHARLERRFQERTSAEVRGEMKRASFKAEAIKANARSLRKLVSKLEWKPGKTAWTDYREESTYTDESAAAKAEFVRRAAAAVPGGLVWDLGCNDGAYSRIAAEHAGYVVAADFDHATVDGLYRRLDDEGSDRILPLVANLADPSPGLGWRGAERLPLDERGRPALTLALALIHHLTITANVPMPEVLDWFRSLGSRLVIEFPTREDPMVKRLLAGKREGLHGDYELAGFERLLRERFTIEQRSELPGGTRVIFEAAPA